MLTILKKHQVSVSIDRVGRDRIRTGALIAVAALWLLCATGCDRIRNLAAGGNSNASDSKASNSKEDMETMPSAGPKQANAGAAARADQDSKPALAPDVPVSGPGEIREIIAAISNLDMRSLNRMEVRSEADGYYVKMWVLLVNRNQTDVRLRDGEYTVFFDLKDNAVPMNVGVTRIEDQVLAGQLRNKGETLVPLDIKIGPNTRDTLITVFSVINLIGNPGTIRQLTVKGKSEAGLQVRRGWAFESGRKFEVELAFTPEIQDKVLMR